MTDDKQPATSVGDKDTSADEPPKLRDVPSVVTQQTVKVGGQQLNYHVTTGMLPLKNAQDEIEAQIFFRACLKSNAGDD